MFYKSFWKILLLVCVVISSYGQEPVSGSVSVIIEKIAKLESAKDPKCYATANRLEDFMYGTPLSTGARNLRIEIQKEISLYVRTRASWIAEGKGQSVIGRKDVVSIIDSMALVGKLKDGDFYYKVDSLVLRIRKVDFDQYSSVAYGFRSLLSLEQDLLFVEAGETLMPLDPEAVEALNSFLNLSTLASLNLSDQVARERQQDEITEALLRECWIRILSSHRDQKLFSFDYPKLDKMGGGNEILRQVIRQKIDSYEQYNQLNTSVFLRNIQVFFAKQKWPTDEKLARELKNYYLESLIVFTKELIRRSHQFATARKDRIVRLPDVHEGLQLFLPFEVNNFEDVTYFPKDETNLITIEAYDLDAFRDGGIHWQILEHALEDPTIDSMSIDPTAAELIVEGVAQLGVLILRISGILSHKNGSEVLTIGDMEASFKHIQEVISDYSTLSVIKPIEQTNISQKDISSEKLTTFVEVREKFAVDFYHRSSDWLSRFIRSYVYSEEEGVAKLAIPQAFGGGGVAAEDLDNDGNIDLLLLGGLGNKLWINDSSGVFKDVTETVPINVWDDQKKSLGEPRQPIIADFNNDGFQDIFITYVNDLHCMIKNVDGSHFQDVSSLANLDGRGAVAGPATAFDYDNDGLLDIYIGYFGNYLKGTLPTLGRYNQNGMPNRLYRNLGDFKFEEVLFAFDSLTDNGWTQAVGHADINQDGRQDLIVGNDFGVNRYYLNTVDHGFIEMSKTWKTDKPSYTMNVGIGDLNQDQHPDFYISNIVVMQKEEKYVSPNEQTTMKFDPDKMARIRTVEANDLFVSRLENGVFSGYQSSDDIGRGFTSTGWSWDADFFDYDNDGDEDLYCLNGMNDFRVYSAENPHFYAADDTVGSVTYAQSNREKNVFFVNENGHLINKAEELGTDLLSNSRSAAYLDFDNDGDLDIVINNYHDRFNFLENQSGNQRNWLKVKLVGDPLSGVNLDAIGSSLTLESKSNKRQWREVHSTTGYLSVHPKEQHFGLGRDEEADLKVTWSNGVVKYLKGLRANQKYRIQYPDKVLY